MISFQRITLSFLLVSDALFAYLIPYGSPHICIAHHAVGRRADRNGKPNARTYQSENNTSLRRGFL